MLTRRLLFLRAAAIFALLILFNSHVGSADECRVTKVVDGDTVVLEDGRHVRYIGIDTPERGYPYYAEAKRENERLVKDKVVRLEYDVGKTDRYGRDLAYVYEGDIFVNAELVRKGFAMIYTFPPNVQYESLFINLQKEAREKGLGFWKLGPEDLAAIKSAHKRGKAVAETSKAENKSFWDYLSYRFKRMFR